MIVRVKKDENQAVPSQNPQEVVALHSLCVGIVVDENNTAAKSHASTLILYCATQFFKSRTHHR